MKQNFKKEVFFDGKMALAVLVAQHRTDGTWYEVNVPNYPRFYMFLSPLGRYDVALEYSKLIPYELVLAVSDAIEEQHKK